MEGDLVLRFLTDGFLTKLVIFSAINFFMLGSVASLAETLVTIFYFVYFQEWIKGDLVLCFLTDGFLTRLAIFLANNLFIPGSAPLSKKP